VSSLEPRTHYQLGAVAARICATAAPVGAAKMLRDIVPARARGPCLRMSALMVRRTEFVHGAMSAPQLHGMSVRFPTD
jgi:hypothetical protein